MRAANLALRFALELALLAAFAYWGAGAGNGPLADVALAVVAPLAAMLVWGLLVSPKARFPLSHRLWIVVQVVLFVAASAALWSAGQGLLGVVLLVAFALNLLVLLRLGEPLPDDELELDTKL